MPYTIKEKKGKKDKNFSVVNKETGKIMSKGTTKEKAKKQIKAIYANMRPEHRLRHRIGLIEGQTIKHPVHREVIKEVRKLLKKEEIHGSGFWSWFNFLDPEEHPVLALVLGGTKPEMVVEAVKDYGLDAVTALLEPWTFPFAVASALHYAPADDAPSASQSNPYSAEEEEFFSGYSQPSQSVSQPASNTQNYYDDEDEDWGHYNNPVNVENIYNDQEDQLFDEEEGDIYDEVEEDIHDQIQEAQSIKKEIKKESVSPVEKLDQLVEKIMEDEGLSQSQRHGLDDAMRFPSIYNYDDNNKPMYLQEWLLDCGVSGKNFTKEEFSNTVNNQAPYAFLNFPINGGRLGKINYSKLGYSKY